MNSKIKKVLSEIEDAKESLRSLGRLIRIRQDEIQELAEETQQISDTEDIKKFEPAAVRFLVGMQEKLNANSWKSGWENMTEGSLHYRLVQEVGELSEALQDSDGGERDSERICGEAYDVANFLMMIVDNFGRDS